MWTWLVAGVEVSISLGRGHLENKTGGTNYNLLLVMVYILEYSLDFSNACNGSIFMLVTYSAIST
jgi:hypothetical protein